LGTVAADNDQPSDLALIKFSQGIPSALFFLKFRGAGTAEYSSTLLNNAANITRAKLSKFCTHQTRITVFYTEYFPASC
jgi:hypothetical protein